MKVILIYKEKIEVDAPEHLNKEEAIEWAVEHVDEEGVQLDYYWHDAYVR